MEQRALQNVNTCLNTNIYSYLETSGGQSYNLYLNVVHFFNTGINYKSVAAWDSCFHALVSNIHYFIWMVELYFVSFLLHQMHLIKSSWVYFSIEVSSW